VLARWRLGRFDCWVPPAIGVPCPAGQFLEPTLPLGVNGALGVASALLADPPAEPDDGRMNYTNDAFAWLLVALLVGTAATAILWGAQRGSPFTRQCGKSG
jgi:hypothetical protein